MIADTGALRTVFQALGTQQIEQVTVRPAEDGWHIVAVSPDRVSMVAAHIRVQSFTDYAVWDEFAVGTAVILDALSSMGPSADIDISTGRLVVKGNGLTCRKPLYAPDGTAPRMPTLQYDAEVAVSSDRVMLIMSKGDVRYGTCLFTLNADGLDISCENDQALGTSLRVTPDECLMLEGEGRARYPLSAWLPFIKAVPKDTPMHISFGTNYPLMAEYSAEGYVLRWTVAPHVEEGED